MATMKSRMTLTPELAHAAGWDAGNASMRKAGRTKWSLEDRNVAAATTNRLMAYIMPPEVVRMMHKHGQIDDDHPALKREQAA